MNCTKAVYYPIEKVLNQCQKIKKIAKIKHAVNILDFIKTIEHRPNDPPTAYHELTLNKIPDSKHILYSKVLENFRNHLFPE